MGTRTANGTGNIRKRPNGTWEARLSYVDGDGTLKRVSVYGKTQREVREKTKARFNSNTAASAESWMRACSPDPQITAVLLEGLAR